MTETNPSICDSCNNRINLSACRAFDRIPDDILVWGAPHTSPFSGQLNDVVWSFAPGTEKEFEDWRDLREIVG